MTCNNTSMQDIVDHEVDAKVSRTKSRSIPSGEISVNMGLAFCVFQSLVTVALFKALLPAEAYVVIHLLAMDRLMYYTAD
jgi:4-hydroxybenzoate polyprenyltransferase